MQKNIVFARILLIQYALEKESQLVMFILQFFAIYRINVVITDMFISFNQNDIIRIDSID
jgi:hypothetical protein